MNAVTIETIEMNAIMLLLFSARALSLWQNEAIKSKIKNDRSQVSMRADDGFVPMRIQSTFKVIMFRWHNGFTGYHTWNMKSQDPLVLRRIG